MRFIRFIPSAALLAAAPLASAQFFDGFEGYPLFTPIEGAIPALGSPGGGWHNWDSITPPGNQNFNVVMGTSPPPFDGIRMLRVVGSGIVGNFLSDTVNELNGPYTAGKYTFTIRQYIPSSFSGTQYVILLNEYTDGGAGPYSWSFQCSFSSGTGKVHMDVFNTAAATEVHGDLPIVFNTWAEIKVEIDLDTNTGKSYYNGCHMWDIDLWGDVIAAGGTTAIKALDLFPATVDTSPVFYDNVNLSIGIAPGPIGTNYCISIPNSTGEIGRIDAYGSNDINANNVTLTATCLPSYAAMFFINSLTPGFVANPSGNQGNLCLGGSIGRWGGSQVLNSGPGGRNSLGIDLTLMPQPTGFVMVTAGQTWYFQCWHRDVVNGMSTHNFTDATSVFFP